MRLDLQLSLGLHNHTMEVISTSAYRVGVSETHLKVAVSCFGSRESLKSGLRANQYSHLVYDVWNGSNAQVVVLH